jgi:23S rRNA (adenine2503-C2)-methyltransferase
MSLDEMKDFVSQFGKESYRAGQLMEWLYHKGARSFDEMTNLSKAFRARLAEASRISLPMAEKVAVAADGVQKSLFRLEDGARIETVLIPEQDHDTLCVSSQVGCAMGCAICRTAAIGWRRNLSAGEILGQILAVRALVPGSRITNVVFMGMGEPLANFDAVIKALRIMSGPSGPHISWRRTTISTCGLVPGIRRLGREARAKLAVSLNAVTDEQRDILMPINRRYPLAELLSALRAYPLARGHRITIEYVLVSGINDTDADARRLVRLLNPIRAKVNLIPLNEGAASGLARPSPDRVARFRDILMSRALLATIRESRGADILAACGQLAASATAVP